MTATDTLRIATRESRLALWQAEHVAARLRAAHAGLAVELVPMTTKGDQILDRSLSKIGGKGLFIKELEHAMLEGRADIAVHSMKDVPAEMPEPFAIAAILERENPQDAFVCARYATIDALPEGATLGTSSLRRQSQLLNRRPDLNVKPVRGNVDTRLAKFDAGEFDAIILAAAGLLRLELTERIAERLPVTTCLPAIGQGAIGIECRAGDERVTTLLAALHHDRTAREVTAERALNAALGGSCHSPIAGFATTGDDGRLRLDGYVGDVRGE
ncbi:MAG: hydroxymethylbilane synthase, partial [Pseudomonadota bacterium]